MLIDMKNDHSVVPRRVVEQRNALNLSQADLAKRIGSTQQSIDAIENGKVRRPTKLHELARALNADVEYLLGAQDHPRRTATGALMQVDKPSGALPEPNGGPDDESVIAQQMSAAATIPADMTYGLIIRLVSLKRLSEEEAEMILEDLKESHVAMAKRNAHRPGYASMHSATARRIDALLQSFRSETG